MKKTPITQEHLSTAQKIISFVQGLGWDIERMEICRWDDRDPDDQSWKAAHMHWSLLLSCSPKPEEDKDKKEAWKDA